MRENECHITLTGHHPEFIVAASDIENEVAGDTATSKDRAYV